MTVSHISVIDKAKRAAGYAAAEAHLRTPSRSREADNKNLVVSLTTYPARIESVWKTLESLHRQSLAPSVIILVLSLDEFPDRKLPRKVESFRERGLRIIFVKGNIRSYKKLIPTLEEFPEKTIVTADDDVLYPRRWLEDLARAHASKPNFILGHRGTKVVADGNVAAPYVSWPQADLSTPSSRVFLTGLGGILYPSGSLPDRVLDMKTAFELCPTADDIWFKAMALASSTPTAKVSDASGDFFTVREVQASSLRGVNVSKHGNDQQFKSVMDRFSLWPELL